LSIRVLLADDQTLVRAGFRVLLEKTDDIEVVDESASGAEAVEMVRRHRPDVVLMDIRMPELDGIEATRRILADERTSGTQIIVLTTFELDEYVFEALRAGASGFLLKDIEPDDLRDAIRIAARGEALLSPSVTRRLIDEFVRKSPSPRDPDRFAGADGKGAGGRDPGRRGALERGDRCPPVHEPGDGQDACEPGDGQARGARPRAARRDRVRNRARRLIAIPPRS
jgi:DNA-binding NarL/FixJ family response regulator